MVNQYRCCLFMKNKGLLSQHRYTRDLRDYYNDYEREIAGRLIGSGQGIIICPACLSLSIITAESGIVLSSHLLLTDSALLFQGLLFSDSNSDSLWHRK